MNMNLNKAKEIINKIRELYKIDERYNYLVNTEANVKFVESTDKQDMKLECIEFSWYDTLQIFENNITYIPEHGRKEVILTYSGWKELLNM